MSPLVFISYRRVPSAMLATLLAKELQDRGIDVFVDTRNMDGGGSFPNRLRDAIDHSDVFLCLLADTTLESDWVQQEIAHANTKKKILLPIFQESFDPSSAAINKDVQALLDCDAIHIMDIKNIMIDETIEQIADVIKSSVKKAEKTDQSRNPARRMRWTISFVLILVVIAGIILASSRQQEFAAGSQALPSPSSTQTETATTTPTPEPSSTPKPTITPTSTAVLSPSVTPAQFDTASSRGFSTVITVQFAWLRREPNAGADQIALVWNNQPVIPLGQFEYESNYDQWWWYVRFGNQEGWVEQQSLREVVPTQRPAPSVCNYNRVCEYGENDFNCPYDCGSGGGNDTVNTPIPQQPTPTLEPPLCDYDTFCDAGENTSNCPSDCLSSSTTTSQCNFDAICNAGEDHLSCPSDC
ncbi:MAG: TIR domain-containing protein [Anaerolineae bacterium]|nr:TIR domain-containing protein [Anaerolineae bacterium]